MTIVNVGDASLRHRSGKGDCGRWTAARAPRRNSQARFSAAHVSDGAKLYVLALGKGEPGARYHGSAEEGVTARALAEGIGRCSGPPVRSVAADEVERYFVCMAPFASRDVTASNACTRARLGWAPTGLDLLTDLAAMDYSAITAA